jgi:lysozyme
MKPLLDLIKHFEGCHRKLPDGRLTAYKCPAGVWTIGWGATGKDIKEGTIWTQAEADARLERDARSFIDGVLKLSPSLQDHPGRLYAVADFAYNLGLGAYGKSTMRKHIDAGQWNLAANEFQRWNKAAGKVLAGLTLRRAAERHLFIS